MRRRGVLCFGAAVTSILILLCALPATAHKKKTPADRSLCKANFSVVQEDALKNITQGLSKKDAKWFEKDIQKKYPDVCYVPPAPDVSLVFLVTVTAAVYHGTRSENEPVDGTVTDQNGNDAGTVDGSVATTVPYSKDYGIFTLTVETKPPGAKWKPLRRFQQKGLYKTYTSFDIPLGGKGHHPLHTVLEEAAKWIHKGGLTNPLETVAPQ